MIKLLLVDDESTTRKGLLKHIPWKDIGISMVEEARDGIEAIEIAQRFEPDILLSDIRMPGLNGIELAEKVRDKFPQCKIIFLSGYSDKEYLKSAIKLGAVNYVEKPIDLAEVKETVQKAVELCIEEEKKRLTEESANTVLTENTPFIRQKIVAALIEKSASLQDILKDIKLLNINFSAEGQFYAVVIKLYIEDEESSEKDKIDYNNIISILDQCLSEIDYISAYRDRGKIVMVISSKTNLKQNRILDVFEAVQDKISKEYMNEISIFCAVGESVIGMEQIYKSYNTAEVALKKLFFYGYNNIAFYKINPGEPFILSANIEDKFTEYLSQQREKELVFLIENLSKEIKKYDTTSVNDVKNIFFKLAFQLFMEAEKRGVYFSEAGENEEKYLWDIISKFQTLDEIKDYMINKISTIFKKIEELESSSRAVFQVKKYIEKNYGDENLSTKTLADHVYLTPTYLSGLFKKETGKTISEFIIEVRIEKSKYYLKDSKLKLFEVAKNVGYNDANYYAKVFKKLVGLTPSEYREKYMQ